MKHHPRYCPRKNMRRVYGDPFITIDECKDCKARNAEPRMWLQKIHIPPPIIWVYIKFIIAHVLGDNIDWHKEGDF